MDHPSGPPSVVLARTTAPTTLRRARRRRELERIEWGAYLPPDEFGGEGPAWELARRRHLARCAAAVSRLSASTVLSHLSAASIHGLWVPPLNENVHVTQAFRSNSRDVGSPLVRHRRPLESDEVVRIGGVPLTSLDRTVIDCVCMLPPDWGFAVADSALRALTSPDRSRPEPARMRARSIRARWLRDLERRGPRRGRRRAREILARADPLSESPGESRLRGLVVAEGLPTPTPQLPVAAGGHVYFADLGWVVSTDGSPSPVVLEFDGRDKYSVPGAYDAQEFRERTMRSAGARLVRFVAEDLAAERTHLIVPKIRAVAPDLVPDRLDPILHLTAQPRSAKRGGH